MLPHVIPGAESNSATRDPSPKCYLDARIQVREDLHNRIDGATRLIWIHGLLAGVGKSAIMQTTIETTCATLFFSSSSDPPRNDSKKVPTTLAYNLAVANDGYYRYIKAVLSTDPFFREKSPAEWFHRLFIAPFINNLVEET
ncbi:hypothetical protein P691DRAFT_678007 [Macrolepiota fuliginosa MF-IS2]|uniref:Nephrocystin 3-like N-terminal domain-containing protein n=1 Tax=Macrolepiota fuliginosa MF-IS2 TaxID=1400762 RepID=A0A9P6C0B3_9AGAR|nr:hypothetical protein P691DRAFT_678007 [Macrolepiota fuliginosa MF-IS2]